jgi:TonB family protein
MKKAAPPAAPPAGTPAAPAPAAPQPQASAPAPRPAPQASPPAQSQLQLEPLPSNPQNNPGNQNGSGVEAPRPNSVPARPSFATGPENPNDAIRQAMRGAGGTGTELGGGQRGGHGGLKSGAEILSDTMGVDFGPYMNRVIRETYRTWDPLIPAAVAPPISKHGVVTIEFILLPDGSVKAHSMNLVGRSGDVALDRAAWGAIQGSDYPPLPREFKGPYLALRFHFLYNPRPDE